MHMYLSNHLVRTCFLRSIWMTIQQDNIQAFNLKTVFLSWCSWYYCEDGFDKLFYNIPFSYLHSLAEARHIRAHRLSGFWKRFDECGNVALSGKPPSSCSLFSFNYKDALLLQFLSNNTRSAFQNIDPDLDSIISKIIVYFEEGKKLKMLILWQLNFVQSYFKCCSC